MNVLQISPQVPFPLDDGGKVSIFNITKSLAERGHRITMLAFDFGQDHNYDTLRKYCDLHTIPHSRENSFFGVLANAFSSLPYNISKYQSRKFARTLTELVDSKTFDVLHVDYLHMAGYGLLAKSRIGIPVVLREHDVQSTIMERYATTVSNPLLRLFLNTQVRKIRAYESKMLGSVDCCCAITEVDANRIRDLQPSANVTTIPAGVDSSMFDTTHSEGQIPESIVFFGGMNWIPNQDAVHWFVESILPRVIIGHPKVKFFILGKDPPPSIKNLESESIIVKGFVPDLHNELQKYRVAIAPFRIGGGLRIKIIECFALKIPVVSTSIGCEGIAAVNGKSIMIEDDVDKFARSIISLFEDDTLRTLLTKEAFNLVTSQYRWESVAEKFEQVYVDVIDRYGNR